MRKLKTIMSVTALSVALAGALPAAAQTTAQPFTPYNGSNGASPVNSGNNSGQVTGVPAPAQLGGLANTGAYNGGTPNYNPACNRSDPNYNPNACR